MTLKQFNTLEHVKATFKVDNTHESAGRVFVHVVYSPQEGSARTVEIFKNGAYWVTYNPQGDGFATTKKFPAPKAKATA